MKNILWGVFLLGIVLAISPFYTKKEKELTKSYRMKKRLRLSPTTEEKLAYWVYRFSALGAVMASAGLVGLVFYYVVKSK